MRMASQRKLSVVWCFTLKLLILFIIFLYHVCVFVILFILLNFKRTWARSYQHPYCSGRTSTAGDISFINLTVGKVECYSSTADTASRAFRNKTIFPKKYNKYKFQKCAEYIKIPYLQTDIVLLHWAISKSLMFSESMYVQRDKYTKMCEMYRNVSKFSVYRRFIYCTWVIDMV